MMLNLISLIKISYFNNIFYIFLYLIFLILSVAYFTLLERKLIGVIQRRKGPNYIGFFGVLQPISDAIKLILKKHIILKISYKYIYLISPFLIFFFSFFI